jgi:hypothetical protein
MVCDQDIAEGAFAKEDFDEVHFKFKTHELNDTNKKINNGCQILRAKTLSCNMIVRNNYAKKESSFGGGGC